MVGGRKKPSNNTSNHTQEESAGAIETCNGDCVPMGGRRRARQHKSKHMNHHYTNGSCKHRSGSREAGRDLDNDSFVARKRDSAVMTEQTPGCSVDTQTNAGSNDVVLGMCSLDKCQRVEAIAELVQCLSVHEQRYLGCCIEAAVRCNPSHLREQEMRYNDARYMHSLVESASCRRLLELAFPMLSVLHSTNRQTAAIFLRLLERVVDEWTLLTNSSVVERDKHLDMLRLAISAALYHPAFSIEHKMKLDVLRNHLHAVARCSWLDGQASPSSAFHAPVVISALHVTESSPGVYSIEVAWSDERTSYVVKTGDQIAHLHQRLLDLFPHEAGVQTDNPRVLPYLNRAQTDSVLAYIRALADLPARVLVCGPMQEFFYTSRLDSSSLTAAPQSICCQMQPARRLPPPSVLPLNPNGLLSCCNCAGVHSFASCPQPTMLQVIASGDYKLDVEGTHSAPPSDLSQRSSPPPPNSFSTPPPLTSQ